MTKKGYQKCWWMKHKFLGKKVGKFLIDSEIFWKQWGNLDWGNV